MGLYNMGKVAIWKKWHKHDMGAGLCGLICGNHVTQVACISVQVGMVVWINSKE